MRDRFRHVLGQAKLGYLQGSVWIAPAPLDKLREAVCSMTTNLDARLFFEGRPFASESDSSLVNGAWDFARLAQAHRECLGLLAHPPADADASYRWHVWLAKDRDVRHCALDIDLLLPAALLPKGYLGQEVYSVRRPLLA